MRLEELNPENVKGLEDWELHSLRNVANRAYDSSRRWMVELAKRRVGVARPIARDVLLDAYETLATEMKARSLRAKPDSLDGKLVRKALRGIDVAELPPITVSSSIVSLSGDFVTSPRSAGAVTVRVDASELSEQFTYDLEKRMAEAILAQTGKGVVVRRDADGLESPVLPVYDLVLVPRTDTIDESDIDGLIKRLTALEGAKVAQDALAADVAPDANLGDSGASVVEFGKPFPSEHAARQLDPKGFREFKRENNKFGKGIHAIWGITTAGKTKLQSIRFSASKFSAAEAKTWLKDHKHKATIEEASGVKKASFLKSEAERIVGGIVYTKDTVDGQGDSASGEDIYEAMKGWMLRGHPIKFMHKGGTINCPVVECFYADVPVTKGGEKIPGGSWYIANYIPPEHEKLWRAIKDGEITGYSMAGTATAKEV